MFHVKHIVVVSNMNEKFMELAIKEAKKAYKREEVPVGAIIVKDNKVISKTHNMVEKKKDCTLHAEIIAIKKASKKLKNWRLNDCEMYVTLEPCKMCMTAIELSRIKKVYFLIQKDKEINFNKDKYSCIKYKNDEYLNLIQSFFKKRR